jgi:D-amino-acid dehydrogenase
VTLAYAALIQQATQEHQPWMAAVGAGEVVQRAGFRYVFRSAAAFDEGVLRAQRLQADHGVNSRIEDAGQLARAEPALRPGLAGAIHWQDAWAVRDPGGLVQAYVQHFVRQGGSLHRARMQRLQQLGQGWRVHTDVGPIDAAHVVLALGPWTDQALAPLGYRSTLLIKRGYHMHYQPMQALQQPVLDAERGYVLAPMRRGLRLTTGAEFAAVDAPATPRQVPKAERCAREILDFGQALDPSPWLGARPCTVDMLPIVGAAPRHAGLWLNHGHGHQGFTLGPVTGRLLAEIMGGQAPLADPTPYSPLRLMA